MNDPNLSREWDEHKPGDGSRNEGVQIAAEENLKEVLVCPSCFEPLLPHAHLCSNCGAPVSARAMMDPLASIWGEGYAYRQATKSGARPNRVVLIGIWLIFFPGVLTIGMMLLEFAAQAVKDLSQFRNPFAPRGLGITTTPFTVFVLILILGIQSAILIRVTRNYRRSRKIVESDQETVEE
ncbi:MAG TPA: zinc ribbon domain-containing protein [Planctomycetaceae bacterium]|nr:zinc ribbon domain-containing protein [Planctomycetaceae bacterium]